MPDGMIYSPGRRTLFIHIPKTGGTSLSLALESRAMRDDILIGDTPKAQRRRKRVKDLPAKGRLWKHSRVVDLDGWLGAEDLADLFVFTLVRNPWDRMVSYYHWLQAARFDHPAVTLARALSFPDFLSHPDIQASIEAAPSQSYVTDTSGKDRCSLYVRLENLHEDIRPLEAHLGFAMDIPHSNASTRRPDYRGYYNDALAEIVARIARQDIAQFGYRF